MSKDNFKNLLWLIGILLISAFLATRFFGPGLGDFSDSIINGYTYDYVDNDEISISYRGEETQNGIVIDSRVDQFRVEGNKILVARRPRETYIDRGFAKGRLTDKCEYWVIDTSSHQVQKLNESSKIQDLFCKGLAME